MVIFWKRHPKLKTKTQTTLPDRIKRKVGLRPKILRHHGHMQADIDYSGLSPLGTSERLDQIKQIREQLQVELADSLSAYKEKFRC